MPTETIDTIDTLTRIRQARREISREFDNDPQRLVAHYMELQNARPAQTPAASASRAAKKSRTGV